MMRRLVECVPNISEGRDQKVVNRLIAKIQDVSHVELLDVHVDPDHHRSVFTMVGEPEAMASALFRLIQQAQRDVDIREHQGEHPRIGVVDVIPWIPFQKVSMADCVRYANELGVRIGKELEIPVFLYEQAGRIPVRAKLENIRRGGLAALGARMKTAIDWCPDYGPQKIHPTAGAVAIGARFFLIAFNVVLQSEDLLVADRIAKSIRTSNGGLSALKARGVRLSTRNLVQVSMNLTDYRQTSLRDVFDVVRREAQLYEIEILESEIVGLVPQAAWDQSLIQDLKLRSTTSDPILEYRLEQSEGI